MSNFLQTLGFLVGSVSSLATLPPWTRSPWSKLWETQRPSYCLLPLIIPSKKKQKKTQLSLSLVPHPLNRIASGTTCRAAACLGICRMDLGIAVSCLWFQRVSGRILLMVQKSGEKTTVWMVLKLLVNNGINYLSLNWWSPDFWTINSILQPRDCSGQRLQQFTQ